MYRQNTAVQSEFSRKLQLDIVGSILNDRTESNENNVQVEKYAGRHEIECVTLTLSPYLQKKWIINMIYNCKNKHICTVNLSHRQAMPHTFSRVGSRACLLHMMVGGGIPITTHCMVTVRPTPTTLSLGFTWNVGRSEKEQIYQCPCDVGKDTTLGTSWSLLTFRREGE